MQPLLIFTGTFRPDAARYFSAVASLRQGSCQVGISNAQVLLPSPPAHWGRATVLIV